MAGLLEVFAVGATSLQWIMTADISNEWREYKADIASVINDAFSTIFIWPKLELKLNLCSTLADLQCPSLYNKASSFKFQMSWCVFQDLYPSKPIQVLWLVLVLYEQREYRKCLVTEEKK